ncbi:hypothetical protein E1A91_A11G261900v1 [Gossypium mustelinum]|uniref:Uncharacterized protein n=1 Tax=Gossypium mustelinum TaxID=34275 RepID=A0A5D2XB00_GOSMU|nr:hypothetical protein E1A91_A11G261900v1 [Gossypium mustelinum]
MVGFFFRRILQHRSQILLGQRLRAMRFRLGRERRRNMRAMELLEDWEGEAAEMEDQIRRIRGEMERQLVADIFTDLWVYDCLIQLENDPFMRDALQRIHAQNLDPRNLIYTNQLRPFQERRRRYRRRRRRSSP